MARNEALTQAVSDSLCTVRILFVTKFLKPLKEIESNSLPQGWIHLMSWMLNNGNTPVSMTDLSLATHISKPNVTPIIDRLCQDGFVERIPDKSDRRMIKVELTKKGIGLLHNQKAVLESFIKDRLSLLEEEELKKLENALNDIATAIEVIEERRQHD